jgi:hypothetical protein
MTTVKKGTPDRGSAERAVAAAAGAATREQTKRPEDEGLKFVNIRFKESDYQDIAKLAVDAGNTKAGFCKAASLYVAEMIGQGALAMRGNTIIDRRGGK